MDEINSNVDTKVIQKYLKNTIHYTVNKKVNQYIDKLETSIKLLENNLNITNTLFNFVKEKNSILENKIILLTDSINELKNNNYKNKIKNKNNDYGENNDIYTESHVQNIILQKSTSFKNYTLNEDDNDIDKISENETDSDNKNENTSESTNESTSENENNNLKIRNKKNTKKTISNIKNKDECNEIKKDENIILNKKFEYCDVKVQNFDLDIDFTKKCLHYCNIEGDLKLFKKMYVENVPKEYYPIRHIKKKFQYWLDGHMNDDLNGTYIITTIIKNIEKIYLKINTFDNYISDMDQFFKNQEHINSLSDQKYKDKLLSKIIQLTNI